MTSLAESAKRSSLSWFAARFGGGTNGAVMIIAIGAGIASFSMNFWIPFLPLYMQELGATTNANALFWVGVATTGQGFARLVSGPLWGILSDHVGRKLMYIRALYFATATTAIAAFATEPWHVAIAFACQGLFSGFIPAAVALTSVTVPDSKLSSSLGLVTGAQYLGNTVGPAVGAVLAIGFGMRGAIIAAAIMPAVAATLVLLAVPRDRAELKEAKDANPADDAKPVAEPSFWRSLSVQFYLAIFLYFFIFGTTQLVRLATPLALGDISGSVDTEGVSGIAFTISGVASVIGVMVIGRRYIQPGRFVPWLVALSMLTAVAHVLMAGSPNVALYVLFFSVTALVQAAMLPASNTLIASNVSRERRGTAFGLAASAQALAFMVGPMSAAGFAAISFGFGFTLLGVLFFGLGLLLWRMLREPVLMEDPPTAKPGVEPITSHSR